MDYHRGFILRLVVPAVLIVASQCFSRPYIAPKSMTSFGPEMGIEMLVAELRARGDHSAETNAHRIILSVQTASNFINDVLESAISKTLHSAVTSRENLFFSLQRMGNDSRRIFDLVDRATSVVSDTAKKAKAEINDAIKTSLDHLRESMKIIIRNLPESKLSDKNMASIIENGQYRMEVVVENSGQRIIDSIHSYRSHFIKIEKDTGVVMVDPESSQEATDAVKNIITAAKSQIQEAVSGSTSFILARIRDSLSNPAEPADRTTTTVASTVTVIANGTETWQAEVITGSQMEDPQEDKLVVVGDVPAAGRPISTESNRIESTAVTESPMIINTPFATTAPEVTTVDSLNGTQNMSTPKVVSWQDDIPKGSVFGGENQENEAGFNSTLSSNTTVSDTTVTSSSTVPSSTLAQTTEPVLSSTQTPAGPLIRRRIPQIKPIVSGSLM